jgi:hypothetical protein
MKSATIGEVSPRLLWAPELKKQDISNLLDFTLKSPHTKRRNSKAKVSKIGSDYREIFYKQERTVLEITGPVLNKCTGILVKLNGKQISLKTFSREPSIVEIPNFLDWLSKKERSQRNRLELQLAYDGGRIVHAEPLYFTLYSHSSRKSTNKRKKHNVAAKEWTSDNDSCFSPSAKRKRLEPMNEPSPSTSFVPSVEIGGTPSSVESFVTCGFKEIENADHLDLNTLPFIEPLRQPGQEGNTGTTTMASPNFQILDAVELPLPVGEEPVHNSLHQDLVSTNPSSDEQHEEEEAAWLLPEVAESLLGLPPQEVDNAMNALTAQPQSQPQFLPTCNDSMPLQPMEEKSFLYSFFNDTDFDSASSNFLI